MPACEGCVAVATAVAAFPRQYRGLWGNPATPGRTAQTTFLLSPLRDRARMHPRGRTPKAAVSGAVGGRGYSLALRVEKAALPAVPRLVPRRESTKNDSKVKENSKSNQTKNLQQPNRRFWSYSLRLRPLSHVRASAAVHGPQSKPQMRGARPSCTSPDSRPSKTWGSWRWGPARGSPAPGRSPGLPWTGRGWSRRRPSTRPAPPAPPGGPSRCSAARRRSRSRTAAPSLEPRCE